MIESARLRQRPPVEADRAALCAIWADPLVMADLGPVKSAAESDATLARHAGYGAGLGFHAVIRRSDATVVGFCGPKPGVPQTPIANEIEAGWIIARGRWRRGYSAEAMRAVLAWGWAHTTAPRIVAIIARRNAKSRGLMERLGMRHAPALDFTHPGARVRRPARRLRHLRDQAARMTIEDRDAGAAGGRPIMRR